MLENAAVMEDGRDRELEEPLRPWGLVLPELFCLFGGEAMGFFLHLCTESLLSCPLNALT